MEKSIINRRGEYLVVVDVAGTPRDKYSHPAGTWECAMTLADGSPQIIRGAYADGPVMQSIRPDEQAQWAVVGSVSDDKFINILKLLATSKTNAAAALGSISTPKKAASSRENGKRGGRPKEILGKLYYYDGGQCLAEFRRGDEKDWFVWSPKRGQRLATYRTKKELMAAYDRSNNTDGGYGCALLHLDLDTDC